MPDIMNQIAQAVTEKVMDPGSGASSSKPGSVSSEFAKLLNEKLDQSKVMEIFGMSSERQLQSISAEGLNIKPSDITSRQEIRTDGKVFDLLTEVNRSALQMDDIVNIASSGKSFSPAELLAMQAGIAQKVLIVETASKTMEQGVSSTKTVLQTNVS